MAIYDPAADDLMEKETVKVYVTTVIRQEIEAPANYDSQDILNFLAEYQDFRNAFCEKGDGEFRITDITVVDEEID